ncbi:MAG: MarR family transcriptional regulator [Desulfurococcales archaeon]|nr:MarR family transcriptional regulator [Desulfurococcales archaeon]
MGLEAALEFYEARRRGAGVAPSLYYGPRGIPRQTFHNSLNRLLAILGHSPIFKGVLYGRLGCRLCRCGGHRVVWEHYGPGDPPACPGPCRLEEWPGPRPRAAFTWRGGRLSVKLTIEWNVHAVLARLREAFGAAWFTASQAAELLLITTPSASRLLRALEELGMLESTRDRGRNMKRYRVA